jgi:hypothetical protein
MALFLFFNFREAGNVTVGRDQSYARYTFHNKLMKQNVQISKNILKCTLDSERDSDIFHNKVTLKYYNSELINLKSNSGTPYAVKRLKKTVSVVLNSKTFFMSQLRQKD